MRGAFSLVRARWRAMLAAGSLLVLSAPVVPVHAATTGATETYIVLYKDGASSKSAASAVQGAGGQLVYNYQQIGVVIARSNRSDFAANMRAVAGIDGAAATTRFATRLDDAKAEDQGAPTKTAAALPGDPVWGWPVELTQVKGLEGHDIARSRRS